MDGAWGSISNAGGTPTFNPSSANAGEPRLSGSLGLITSGGKRFLQRRLPGVTLLYLVSCSTVPQSMDGLGGVVWGELMSSRPAAHYFLNCSKPRLHLSFACNFHTRKIQSGIIQPQNATTRNPNAWCSPSC